MLNARVFRVEQMSSIKCRCNRPFETDSCTSIPGPLHCKRSLPVAVEGRRGRRSQSPWELPSPRLQPSSSKDAASRRPEIGSPCPEARWVRQVSGGKIRTCTQDTTAGPTSRRQECETSLKQTPRADMERQGQRAPEAARVARLQPRHRHDGKAEACHECQARHAKVRASSHVLIGERGRIRANTHRHLLLRRREPERAQTLARASLASI